MNVSGSGKLEKNSLQPVFQPHQIFDILYPKHLNLEWRFPVYFLQYRARALY